jgi:oxygen-independent coproporphyrinogen-3 oxidase
MKRHQRLLERYALPDAELREELSARAADRLLELGYVRIGLDHFALPGDALARAASAGTLHRNFQGYTTDTARTLLAFGPSGISQLPAGFVQSDAAIRGWNDSVSAGRLPTVRGVALSDQDRLRSDVIESLMCSNQVNLQEIAERHGVADFAATFAHELHALQPFIEGGAVRRDRHHLRITESGRIYLRLVAAVFDQYLAWDSARHSQAV